jgi:hypothetical protein
MKPQCFGLWVVLFLACGVLAAAPVPADLPPPNAKEFGKALEELASGARKLDTFRLDVQWSGEGRGRSVIVYGNGIGILNRDTQFRLNKEQLQELVRKLREAKFADLAERYGGMARPMGGPALGVPVRLLGSVTVSIQGVSRGSTQLGGGEQSQELAKLASGLLDLCSTAAKNGVQAMNLADGLKKIGSAELDPVTLHVLVHRLIEDPKKAPGEEGFLMRIEGAVVTTRTNTPGKGYGPEMRLELTRKQLEELAKLLIDNEAGGLPINLWAVTYTDFVVRVLNHEKNLQARQFAGKTPQTHGEQQKQFDRIYAALVEVHQKALKEGKPVKEEKPQ